MIHKLGFNEKSDTYSRAPKANLRKVQSQNKRIFGILLFLTRRSCIEIGGSDVVGGQDQVQRVQPTRPRPKGEVACLGIEEVE